MTSRIHDVVVIGGGPIGCFAASNLARLGFDVLVIEKDPQPRSVPVCTGIIGVEAFEEFGLPRDTIIAAVKDISLYSPSGNGITYRPDCTQAFVVDRAAFDKGIRCQAEQAGASFLSGAACNSIEVRDDCAVLSIAKRRDVVKAKTVIVASGYNPRWCAKAGFEWVGGHYEGIQSEVIMKDLAETEIYIGRSIAPLSFGWVVPLSTGRARIGLVTKKNSRSFFDGFLDHFRIKERLAEKGAVFRKLIPYGRLKRSYADRTIVVGEAAGQIKSTTHGGIYYGLIGVRCALQTLSEAFRAGNFDAKMMSGYERSWRSVLEKEISRGYFLRKIFSRLTDAQIDKMIDLASKNGIMHLLHEKAKFDWHRGIISGLLNYPLFRQYLGNKE